MSEQKPDIIVQRTSHDECISFRLDFNIRETHPYSPPVRIDLPIRHCSPSGLDEIGPIAEHFIRSLSDQVVGLNFAYISRNTVTLYKYSYGDWEAIIPYAVALLLESRNDVRRPRLRLEQLVIQHCVWLPGCTA